MSDGSTRLQSKVGADDDMTYPLSVYATTPPSHSWNLTENRGYRYESSGNEGLSSGTHTLTFTVKDNASVQNIVTFQRDIFIFDKSPTLTSPANGASGLSTTPTFQWSYNGSLEPWFYLVTAHSPFRSGFVCKRADRTFFASEGWALHSSDRLQWHPERGHSRPALFESLTFGKIEDFVFIESPNFSFHSSSPQDLSLVFQYHSMCNSFLRFSDSQWRISV